MAHGTSAMFKHKKPAMFTPNYSDPTSIIQIKITNIHNKAPKLLISKIYFNEMERGTSAMFKHKNKTAMFTPNWCY